MTEIPEITALARDAKVARSCTIGERGKVLAKRMPPAQRQQTAADLHVTAIFVQADFVNALVIALDEKLSLRA